MPKPRIDYQKERGERQIKRILPLIARKALTCPEIAAALHLSSAGVRIYMKRLREAKPKRAYIADYDKTTGGNPAPRYRSGNKPCAVMHKETTAEWWARVKDDPVAHAKTIEAKRRWRVKTRNRPGRRKVPAASWAAPLLSALM